MLAALIGLALQAQTPPDPTKLYYLDLGTYPSTRKASHAIGSGQRIIGVKTGSIIKSDSPTRVWAYIAGFDNEDEAKAACVKLIAKGRPCDAKPIYPP